MFPETKLSFFQQKELKFHQMELRPRESERPLEILRWAKRFPPETERVEEKVNDPCASLAPPVSISAHLYKVPFLLFCLIVSPKRV